MTVEKTDRSVESAVSPKAGRRRALSDEVAGIGGGRGAPGVGLGRPDQVLDDHPAALAGHPHRRAAIVLAEADDGDPAVAAASRWW